MSPFRNRNLIQKTNHVLAAWSTVRLWIIHLRIVREISLKSAMCFAVQTYLTESVYNVVLQNFIPAQIRQFILCISNNRR